MLTAVGPGVDPELTTQPRSLPVVALTIDAVAAAILVLRRPGDHKSASIKPRNIDLVLVIVLVTVHPERVAQGLTLHVVYLSPNLVARTAGARVIPPGNHKTAATEAGNVRMILVARYVGVDPKLLTHHLAICIVAPPVDVRA